MRFVIVAGTPSSGKTSVMVHAIRHLSINDLAVAACKIDCLQTSDDEKYSRLGIPVAVGLSKFRSIWRSKRSCLFQEIHLFHNS